ncbi:BON domain-containing protein [Neorhizobium lilium]|uniref:BON domain-containing protein n=1 Tax=Neorhizobium lilium TaxID=2503024 RepID=A0A3S3U0U1_9HYPH|nr:BON domain-containing protein [Neorhizobium lilium]RWX79266.1 BON domain-containing protein [Neorhizobium lilium]
MKNEEPKAGRPGETSQWPRWEGPAESRPSGYLQGEANIFADGPETQNHAGEPPADYDRPDHLVEQDIKEKLTQDAFLDPTNLTVTVSGGEVLLEGFVAKLADKEQAEATAMSVHGARSCQNNLRLAPERH